ncbi:MAG: NTP transferase domain-containing protein [Bacteroidales bacterium]|nr:NTP transferase domain-containing protein [Bacteroidales bacterium]
MKIIVPMAGKGKRMRPHTITTPKPLIKIAGKPIVQRLVEDIVNVTNEKIDEIAYVVGDFGGNVEKQLIDIAEKLGARATIYYQKEALGTAHAVLCAASSMDDNLVIAFADTLFKADFKMDVQKDGIIWTHKVDDPSAFGVVTKNESGIINGFVEKPQKFVSDEAIIGIYYFREGNKLRDELRFVVDNNIVKGGEYQLTDVLQNMMNKGTEFFTGAVKEWLDCGNKDATVYTNQRILEINNHEKKSADSIQTINSIIVDPCFIGENVVIRNSIIGPHVSIGSDTVIENSIITNSIIQSNSYVENANMDNSMVGNHVKYIGRVADVSIGDFTRLS